MSEKRQELDKIEAQFKNISSDIAEIDKKISLYQNKYDEIMKSKKDQSSLVEALQSQERRVEQSSKSIQAVVRMILIRRKLIKKGGKRKPNTKKTKRK
ncbi:MAG: hypothetical protein MHPSP_003158 [Paramarteilia canceri]